MPSLHFNNPGVAIGTEKSTPAVGALRRFPRRCGFTLVELLICIGVLLVLLVIAYPALSRMQVMTRNIRCVSNLRGAGAALLSYAAESGNKFRFFARGGNDSGVTIWGKVLLDKRYISDPGMLRCPAGRSVRSITDNAWYWNTYGLNMVTIEGMPMVAAGTTQVYSLRVQALRNPSRVPMLVDSATLAEFEPGVRSETFRVNIQKLTDGVQLRHRNKANAIFMDGHIESLSRPQAEEYFISTLIYDENKTL